MQKQKLVHKNKIILITAVMIGAAVIGFTSQLAEREALAYIPATVTVPKLSKIAPQRAIDKKTVVVDLISNNPSVEVKIREIARAEKFKWPDYLVKLAHCESRLDPKAVNDKGNTPSWSKDRGLFQYNSHWQRRISDACAFDLTCSTKETIRLINAGKQHLWACDKIVNQYAKK